MRQIGTINNESQARILHNCLVAKGIANQIEAEGPQVWAVWVHDEDRLAEARSILERYVANPTAAEWKEAARKASALRADEIRSQKDYERRLRESKDLFPRFAPYGMGLLTLVLIAVCAYVAVRTNLGRNESATSLLAIANTSAWRGQLREVWQGEVWRVLTPILLHFSPLHLIGNMLWLFQLGSLIEDRKGSMFLLGQVVVIGVLSNLAQYWHHGPYFGGMSGVVYGLFGYLWMRGKYDPASGMTLNTESVLLMLMWFLVCWSGWAGPIANTAHTVGLLVGMAWGFLAAKWK